MPVRLLTCLLALSALALSACDSGTDDDSSFARLQGTWERTDAGFTDESVRFGPGQNYTFRKGGGAVEIGLYSTLSGPGSERTFTVRYMGEGARPDEEAVLTDDTLVLTPSGGDARSYRRD